MKCINTTVRGNFPPLGLSWDGMKIVRIFADQSLEQGGDDVMFDDSLHGLRIEILRLGPFLDPQ